MAVRFLRLFIMTFFALRLLGGDLALLQVVAWTGMIVTRTSQEGVQGAVVSTFDGEHPCKFCKALAAIKTPGKNETPLPDGSLVKLKPKDMLRTGDLAIATPVLPCLAPGLIDFEMTLLATRGDAPDVPPPRLRCA